MEYIYDNKYQCQEMVNNLVVRIPSAVVQDLAISENSTVMTTIQRVEFILIVLITLRVLMLTTLKRNTIIHASPPVSWYSKA